jgi:hypothetical protein
MADSMRKQVFDATRLALSTIKGSPPYVTNVAYIDDTLTYYQPSQIDAKNFPGVYVLDVDEKKEYFDVGENRAIRATLEIIVQCMVYDATGDTSQARTDLMRDVEMCLVNDETLNDLLLFSAFPTITITSKGEFPNYSVWDQHFEMKYLYNAKDGG